MPQPKKAVGHSHSNLPGVTGHSPISTCFASNCRFKFWRFFILLWSEINNPMRASERNNGRRIWLHALSQRMASVALCTLDTGLYRKILRRDPTQPWAPGRPVLTLARQHN